jgi:hypothetical protein
MLVSEFRSYRREGRPALQFAAQRLSEATIFTPDLRGYLDSYPSHGGGQATRADPTFFDVRVT